jgi:fructuronate reductase
MAFTEDSPDASEWGWAAFTGRSPRVAELLTAQDGLFTLVNRGPERDRFREMSGLSAVHDAHDHEALRAVMTSRDTAAVTITVTEAGYHLGADGCLTLHDAATAADLAVMRAGGNPQTAVGRLVGGLAARRRAGNGPIAVVPCDNLARNGPTVAAAVCDFAECFDPALASWIAEQVSFVSTVVDRITPRSTEADRAAVAAATGFDDRCPVVAEPFREWVLAGTFPAGRPAWEGAGALLVDDVEAFAQRKLWLLNGAHSLLAYAGPPLTHNTVAEAFADDRCRDWVEQWWDEAARHVAQPETDTTAYRAALAARFSNPRIEHRLAQIAMDGSQKLPVRVLPVLRVERGAGREAPGAARIVAAWVCHLRGLGSVVVDPRRDELVPLAGGPLSSGVAQVLGALDPTLAEDAGLVALVADQAGELAALAAAARKNGDRP